MDGAISPPQAESAFSLSLRINNFFAENWTLTADRSNPQTSICGWALISLRPEIAPIFSHVAVNAPHSGCAFPFSPLLRSILGFVQKAISTKGPKYLKWPVPRISTLNPFAPIFLSEFAVSPPAQKAPHSCAEMNALRVIGRSSLWNEGRCASAGFARRRTWGCHRLLTVGLHD